MKKDFACFVGVVAIAYVAGSVFGKCVNGVMKKCAQYKNKPKFEVVNTADWKQTLDKEKMEKEMNEYLEANFCY